MSAIRLIEVRGPADDVWLRFHPELTVVASTRGPRGRVADEIVDLLSGRRNGAHLVAEAGGAPVAPGVLPEQFVDAMVLRDDDLQAALTAVREAQEPDQADPAVELAELRARRDELLAPAEGPTAADIAADAVVGPLLEAWRALAADVAAHGEMEPALELTEIERRIRQAESVLRAPERGPVVTPEDAAALRAHHEALEDAQRTVEKRASRRALKNLETAEAAERELLDRLGIASYLDFVLGVATTGAHDVSMTPDEATAQLVASQADRQRALEIDARNARRRELAVEVQALRTEITSTIGRDPGDDPETVLLAWRPDGASAPGADDEVRIIEERIAFLETTDGPGRERLVNLDEVLRRALADHPWPEDFGPLPIVVDDALGVLDPDARVHALGILAQLANEVQVVVVSDDPRVSDWGRAQGPHVLVWDDAAAAGFPPPVTADPFGFEAPYEPDDAPERSLTDVLGVFTAPAPVDTNVVDFPDARARDPWADDTVEPDPPEIEPEPSGIGSPAIETGFPEVETGFPEVEVAYGSEALAAPVEVTVDLPALDALEVPEAAIADEEPPAWIAEVIDVEAAMPEVVDWDALAPGLDTTFDAELAPELEATFDVAFEAAFDAAPVPTDDPPVAARDDFWTDRDAVFEESWLRDEPGADDPFAGMSADEAYDAALDFEVRREVAAEEAARREEAARLAAEEAARQEEAARHEAEAVAARLAAELEEYKAAEAARRAAEEQARQEADAAAARLAEEAALAAAEDARRELEAQARRDAELAAARAEEERRRREEAEAARVAAEVRARAEAEAAVARAEEERRLREEAEAARLEAEAAARAAAEQAEAARREAERMRQEAEDEALIARLKAEAHAIIAAEDRAKMQEAEDARREAEAAAQRALEMRERAEAERERAEAERETRRETEHAAAVALEAAARAEEAAQRAAADQTRSGADDAYLARLEEELDAARHALHESRVRSRELARIEAQEIARRDAEELEQRASLSQRQRDAHELSAHEIEAAAQRAAVAARRAEEAAARAEVAAHQEAEDARLLERLEAEAASLRHGSGAVAVSPVSLFQAAPSGWRHEPQSPTDVLDSARRAEEAAARAEEAASRAETMLPHDARLVLGSVREDAIAARDHADRLHARLRTLRSTTDADPDAMREAEEAADRAELSAGRAEEAAARAEHLAREDRLHIQAGPWAGYDATASALRAEEAAARAEEAAARAETTISGEKADFALNARRDASDARHFAEELTRRAQELHASADDYDPVVLRDAADAARRAETSAARAEDAAARAEWLALQEANRARAEAEMHAAAALPSELTTLEAEELAQVAEGDDAGLYELPQEDLAAGPMRGIRKRRAEKLARQAQRRQAELLDTAAKLTKRCTTHNLEDAVAVCGRCEKSYCRHCIVKVGSRGENLCVDCALQAAGVRSASKRRR